MLVALPVERGADAELDRRLPRLRGGARTWCDEVAAVGGSLAEVLLAPEPPTRPATSSYR